MTREKKGNPPQLHEGSLHEKKGGKRPLVEPDEMTLSSSDEYPCHNCGSNQRFSPENQALTCGHCGATNDIKVAEDQKVLEQGLRAAIDGLSKEQEEQEINVVQCNACAAEFEFDQFQHADTCPFCDTAVVTEPHFVNQIKPQGLIPFVLTGSQANDRMRRWLKGLWFAPNKLKLYTRDAATLRGIYIPYWTYDSLAQSSYAGARGDIYYVRMPVTVRVNGRTVTQMRSVAKVRWTPASGYVERHFDDVLVLATHSLPRKITNKLKLWDLAALQPFDNAYLSGFRAETYQIDVREGLIEAEAIMDRIIRRDVRQDIGGDQQRVSWVRTRHSKQTFKHILLPLWISAFSYNGKVYRYVVNGQTGEVQGERPFSLVKISAAAVSLLFLAMVIFYLTRGNF